MMYLSEYEYQALMLSLKVAGFAILWLIPIGIGLAWLLAKKTICRQKHSREHCAPAFGASSSGHWLFVVGDDG